MTRVSIAEELESAAERIADMSRADLQIILRRAALMLRNIAGVSLEPAVEDALSSIAAEMKIGRSDLIRIVLREWLETNAIWWTRKAKRTAAPNFRDHAITSPARFSHVCNAADLSIRLTGVILALR